jgi:hypothetical protein
VIQDRSPDDSIELRVADALDQLTSTVRPAALPTASLTSPAHLRSRRAPILAALAVAVVGAGAIGLAVRSPGDSLTTTVGAPDPATRVTTADVPISLSVPPTTSATTPVGLEPFGEVKPIPDASIFYLPTPMPDGWFVAQVTHGVGFPLDWEETGGSLDAIPPIPDGTFREFHVWMIKADGSATASFGVVETPREAEDRFIDDAERVEVAGINRNRFGPSTDLATAPIGFSSEELVGWVQDGRTFDLEMVGDATDLPALLGAMSQVTGSQLGDEVTAGQHAALELPIVDETVLPDGLKLTARGYGEKVLAACAESSIPTCAFPTWYGRRGVIMGIGSTPTGPRDFGWIPTELVQQVTSSPMKIEKEFGAFVVDFVDLTTGSTEIRELIGTPRADLLGLPRTDTELAAPAPLSESPPGTADYSTDQFAGPTPEQRELFWDAEEKLTAQCMAQRGFDYTPLSSPDLVRKAAAAGLTDLDASIATNLGYHPYDSTQPDFIPIDQAYEVDVELAISQSATVPGFQDALTGGESPVGGCRWDASAALYPNGEPSDLSAPITNSLIPVIEKARSESTELRDAESAWSECMSAAGFDYALIGEPFIEYSTQPTITEAERFTATADATCRSTSQVIVTRNQVDETAARLWIADGRQAQLRAATDLIDATTVAARLVLGSE